MNNEQKKWTLEKCEALLYVAKDFNLSENDFDLIHAMTNEYYNKSKKNQEVKKALFATVEFIEHMYKIFGEKEND